MLEHARDTRPLTVDNIADGWEVVRVGTHTVGFFKNDWTTNPQIPFVDPETSEPTPAWHRAMREN